MIVDSLENWKNYPFGPAWAKAFAHIEALAGPTLDGETQIDGTDILANVLTFESRNPEDVLFESHEQYVDIYTLLTNTAEAEWISLPGPKAIERYRPSTDSAAFRYKRTPPGRLLLSKGIFAVFFPKDGHRVGLKYGDLPARIQVVNIKIRTELLLPGKDEKVDTSALAKQE